MGSVGIASRYPAAAPGERLALSLAGVNMNAETFANGVPIGSGGRMVDPVARNANRPLYFDAHRVRCSTGSRSTAIDVRLFAYANDVGSLGAVGLRAGLRHCATSTADVTSCRSRSRQVDERAGRFCSRVFFGVLWLGRARSLHGWFALASGAWTFVSLNYWVQDPGIAHWTWVRLFYLALGTFTVTIPIATHRLLGIRRPGASNVCCSRARRLRACWRRIASGRVYPRIVTPFQALWLDDRDLRRRRARLRGWRAFSRWSRRSSTASEASCARRLAVAEQFDAWRFGEGWRSAPHALHRLRLVLCLATTLGVRFAVSLQEARRANREFEERVRAKTRETRGESRGSASSSEARSLPTSAARIVREMHDGIGGQLVATLAMVQTEQDEPREVANALRDALDDMRAVIDSMDPLIDDLGKLFGSLRGRFAAAAKRNDLHFVWNVGDAAGDAVARLRSSISTFCASCRKPSPTRSSTHGRANSK